MIRYRFINRRNRYLTKGLFPRVTSFYIRTATTFYRVSESLLSSHVSEDGARQSLHSHTQALYIIIYYDNNKIYTEISLTYSILNWFESEIESRPCESILEISGDTQPSCVVMWYLNLVLNHCAALLCIYTKSGKQTQTLTALTEVSEREKLK